MKKKITKENYKQLGYTGRMRVRSDVVHLIGNQFKTRRLKDYGGFETFGNCKPTLENNFSKFKIVKRYKEDLHTGITKILKDCTVEEVIEKEGSIEYVVFYYRPEIKAPSATS